MSILYSGIGGSGSIDGSINFLQFSTMPTASSKYSNRVVEYVGTTTSTYTNGYIYKCVGTTTEGVTTYAWTRIDVQPAGGTYTLPTASTTTLGGVKIDGTSITINDGVISTATTVPTAQLISGSFTAENNKVYRDSTDISTLKVTLPSMSNTTIFNCEIDYTCITNNNFSFVVPSSYTYGVKCEGDDCDTVSKTFTAVANKRYTISVWFDGKYIRAIIHGIAI